MFFSICSYLQYKKIREGMQGKLFGEICCPRAFNRCGLHYKDECCILAKGNEFMGNEGVSIMHNLKRITFDPFVMGGKPCIRGMRVTVGAVVGLVAAGYSTTDILKAYPYLEAADIQEALAYAAWRAEEIELPLASA
jgi:uncharacterized protein (DUF433 family)